MIRLHEVSMLSRVAHQVQTVALILELGRLGHVLIGSIKPVSCAEISAGVVTVVLLEQRSCIRFHMVLLLLLSWR